MSDQGWLPEPMDYSPEAAKTIQASLLPDGTRPSEIRLHGACPRCAHPMEFSHPLFLVHGVDVTANAEALGVETRSGDTIVDARCQCDEPHEGRPDGSTGCNAVFAVRVVWP
ncbi:MAG TPA: hypothetical protein VF520_05175 [Thermoleophilaceae bacterium]|jgi:hypothetical protein